MKRRNMKRILFAAGCWLLATTAIMAQTQPEPWDGSISGSFKKEGKTIFIDCPADLAALHKLWGDYDDGDQGYKGWTIKLRADLDMNNRNFNGHTIGWNDDNKFGGKSKETTTIVDSSARWTTAESRTSNW